MSSLVPYVIEIMIDQVSCCVIIGHPQGWKIIGVVSVVIRVIIVDWSHSFIRIIYDIATWVV